MTIGLASFRLAASGLALRASWVARRARPWNFRGDLVSIIRIGLAETKHFSEGYAAIFGKKKKAVPEKPAEAKPDAKKKAPPKK